MKILKKYREPDAEWQEVTLEDCIDKTENSGHYKTGTVENMLKQGLEVQTPFAVYKAQN